MPGRPETRQTLRRHVGPKGELRPGGEKGRAVKGRAPAEEAQAGRHRKEDFPHKLHHNYAANPLDAGAERADIEAPPGPRERRCHPDLHQRRAGADGAGGGEVVRQSRGV